METGQRTGARPCERQAREDCLDQVCGGESHAPRLAALTEGVDGVRHAASLGLRALGQGLAAAQGCAPQHASTPLDRRLSHPTRSLAAVWGCGGPCVLGERREGLVICDWTACVEAAQSLGGLGKHPGHGRRTPLRRQTVTRLALLG